MQDILLSLQELDRVYHADTFDVEAYEHMWLSVEQQVRLVYPGFTIAYAEVYTTGSERQAHGGMRHVLFPLECEPSGRIGSGNCPNEH